MFLEKQVWTDRRIDRIIGTLLKVGVTLSALIVLVGGGIYLARHGMEVSDYRIFRGEPSDLCNVSGIVKEALTLHGRGIVQIGLLMLIATPVARVAFAVLAFAMQRDRTYVTVTLIVLAILLYSLAGGAK